MSRQDYPYDEDEFDILGADRTPQGVHRAPVPRWRQLLPFVIVIVLAPLLAWAGVSALSGDFGADPEETPPAATEPAESDDGEEPADPDVSEEPDDEGEPEETEEPEAENGTEEEPEDEPTDEQQDLNREVPVLILNGTTTVGLAGNTAEILNADGWTNTSTADYGQAQPTVTTLYYHDAQVAEEAEAVAAELGIEVTVESASAASAGVVIVLRSDFQAP